MTISNFDALKLLKCPECEQVGSLKEIIYGMPGEGFDFARYAVGGCCLSGDGTDPNVSCSLCEWEGTLELPNQEHEMG
jgi:hypothetical protein